MSEKATYEELEQKIKGLEKDSIMRRQVEDKLRESEHKYQSIIENLPMGIHMYQLDRDGELRFIGANPAADEILGVDNTQYLGKTIYEAFPKIHGTEIPEKFRIIAEKGGFWKKEDIVYKDDKIGGAFENYNFQTSPGKMVSLFFDTTERKQAEVALQESEVLHRVTLANISDAVFITDNKGAFTFICPNVDVIFGYSRQEVQDFGHIAALIGDDLTDLDQLETSGELKNIEKRITDKAGKIHDLLVNAKKVSIKGGTVLYSCRDITERKRAERALSENEKEYRNLYEKAPNAYFSIDAVDVSIKRCNSAALSLLGYDRKTMKQMKVFDLYADTPDGLSKARKTLRHFREGQTVKDVELQMKHKDGESIWVSLSVEPVRDRNGNIIESRSMVFDISERKKTQQLLHEAHDELKQQMEEREAILRSVRDGIATVDDEMRVLNANTAMETICGLKPGDVIGKKFSDIKNPCQKSCVQALGETLETQVGIKEYRIECRHKNRSHQIVSLTSSPLLDREIKFMGAVLVIRDITRIVDLEQKLIEKHSFHNIIGKSKVMQDLYLLLDNLADLETTVLITGESGTGKELAAKALHYNSIRSHKSFIKVNCSALAENLLESEMFGHIKGAFTGAIADKVGRFQAAHEGTILLDEIGDISPRIQLGLLRVLEEMEFERVGESTPTKVDVRVLAATNHDLMKKVRLGEFREDLYYRLKVVEVKFPPLRERMEDIPLLVQHFIARNNKKMAKKVEGISADALRTLHRYAWPGNVRELEHAIEHAFIFSRGQTLVVDDLPAELRRDADKDGPVTEKPADLKPGDIVEALQETGWKKARASRRLGISRSTLYRKIREYGIMENKQSE